MGEQENWAEYRRLVMAELSALRKDIESVNKKIDALREDVVILKVKASVFGGLAGAVFGFVVHLLLGK